MATKARIIDFLLVGYFDPTQDQPLSAGTVDVTVAGTSNAAFVWDDRDKTLPTATGRSTITLDSYGRAEVYGDGIYKFVIKDSSGATIETIDQAEYLSIDSGAVTVTTQAALSAITTTSLADNSSFYVQGRTTVGDGGGGRFYWDTSDLSAQVTADPYAGIYVPPDSDATGASGAFVFEGHSVVPERYGAVGDGSNDDSNALVGWGTVTGKIKNMIPGKTYMTDGSGIPVNAGDVINFNGATVKLIADTYGANLYIFRNRTNATYDVGIAFDTDITINNPKIDGNSSNVTLTGFSSSALYFHQVKNVTVNNPNIVNMPGTSGGLPAIIFKFADNCRVNNPVISNTDRQNIMYWEATGEVIGGSLTLSRFREPIIISSENTPSYQGSHVVVDNVIMNNVGTTSGTHVVRFSGKSSGVIRNCDITGDATMQGVYITFGLEHNILMENNDIRSCSYGWEVDTDGYKTIQSVRNRMHSCTNGIRYNAAGTNSSLKIIDDKQISTTTQPIYTNFCEYVDIRDVEIDSGSTAIFLSNYKDLGFRGASISGMTSASFSVNLSSAASGASLPHFSGNQLKGNTADIITTSVNVLAEGNDISNFIGSGIKLARIGRAFIWEDTGAPGTLYTKTSEPANLTDGTVIGTQT